jgi:hypothetical protein
MIPTIFHCTLRQQFFIPSKDLIAVTNVVRQFRTCAKAVERIQVSRWFYHPSAISNPGFRPDPSNELKE